MTLREGYRDPRSWDTPHDPKKTIANMDTVDVVFGVIERCYQSHDGWECPHCGDRENVYGAGGEPPLSNEDFARLMLGDGPVEVKCYNCYKQFWLSAMVVTKYTTSTSESFDEKDHEKAAESKLGDEHDLGPS